jgi:nicotinamidase-related amidase
MSMPNTPANFDGKKPVFNPNDAVMLLIDHQIGLFQTVFDMPMHEMRARAAAPAKMASLSKISVITARSVPQGPKEPWILKIHANAPHARHIAPKGEINTRDYPKHVAASKTTGGKTLITAGTVASLCVAFSAIDAIRDDSKVFPVIDASGPYSKMAQEITLARGTQAGTISIDIRAVASKSQKN